MKKRKFKTKKSVAKRIKVTARGKLLRRRAGHRHLLSGKTAKQRRRLRKVTLVSKADIRMMKEMVPYL